MSAKKALYCVMLTDLSGATYKHARSFYAQSDALHFVASICDLPLSCAEVNEEDEDGNPAELVAKVKFCFSAK